MQYDYSLSQSDIKQCSMFNKNVLILTFCEGKSKYECRFYYFKYDILLRIKISALTKTLIENSQDK